MRIVLLVLCACLAWTTGPAQAAAPWTPPATLELGLGAGGAGYATALREALRDAGERAAAPGTANLVFKASAAVSRKVEREVVDELAQRNRAQWGPRVEGDLRLANLKGRFDELLRLHGRSPTNLGDVLGVYVVLCWESYAGGAASTAQIAAVSRQWRVALRRSALATRPDAQKQALAEALAWRAVLVSGVARAARAQASPQLFALREGVRVEVLRATGLDFARVRLTARGFEALPAGAVGAD